MANLTEAEILAMKEPLQEPGENNREYGHRGVITSGAIYDQKTGVQADRWTSSKVEQNDVPQTR